jgi:hypothetical protein
MTRENKKGLTKGQEKRVREMMKIWRKEKDRNFEKDQVERERK